MHSSATRVLYAFDQTPSLRVRERGLARETIQRSEPTILTTFTIHTISTMQLLSAWSSVHKSRITQG